MNRCGRCNRQIKDQFAEFGPVCAAKMGIIHVPKIKSPSNKSKKVLIINSNDNENNTLPFEGDIVFYMQNGRVCTNVPRRIVLHSPNGYGWGYLGSGPADFAWNILALFIGKDRAEENGLYQEFKREIVATYPEAGGTISKGLIRLWLKERGIDIEQKSRRKKQVKREAQEVGEGKVT